MKKLIIVFSIFLIGCGRDVAKNKSRVTKIVRFDFDHNQCKYILTKGRPSGLFSLNPAICDTCGKFNVNDTINFTK